MHSPEGMAAFSSYAEKMDGAKVRQRSPSFADHFQPGDVVLEQHGRRGKRSHIVDAFSFELNMVMSEAIREKYLNELLANVADELAQGVGRKIGIAVKRRKPAGITPEANASRRCRKMERNRSISLPPLAWTNRRMLSRDGKSRSSSPTA